VRLKGSFHGVSLQKLTFFSTTKKASLGAASSIRLLKLRKNTTF
jgi:hypothetical protein